MNTLTKRENQILHYVACGYHNKEIACKVGISEQTIKNHVSNIMQKLGIHNRVQLSHYYWDKRYRRQSLLCRILRIFR